MEGVYCRFCAERKRPEKLLNLLEEPVLFEEITQKLDSLNLMLFDAPDASSLPKTVCLVCLDSLRKACQFCNSFRKAQSTLFHICMERGDSVKYGNSDEKLVDPVYVCIKPIKTEEVFVDDHDDKLTFIAEPSTSVKIEIECCSDKYKPDEISNISDAPLCNVSQRKADTQLGPVYGNIPVFKPFEYKSRIIKTWKDYPWLCKNCCKECSSVQELRRHMKQYHNTCGGFLCPDCKDFKIYNGFFIFVYHVRRHWEILRDICPHCNVKADDINEHQNDHIEKPNVICPACGEIQPNEEALNTHKTPHITKPKVTKKRRKPGSPMTKEELTCEFCHKEYASKNNLREHRKMHTGERTKDHTCDRCGKVFYNKGTLTTHILAHDQVKRHACKICKKSFLHKTELRRHISVHSGEKPFSCEECGRCFRLERQLINHKVIHTDYMPFSCQFCPKTFRFKVNLQNHERQHTGDRPYVCSECDMKFTNWSNHNKHMKRRHGIESNKKKMAATAVNPESGINMGIDDKVDYEEFKNEVMTPCKRGKKTVVKDS